VIPSSAQAREGWRGWCEVGNQSVITSGLSSTTKVQRSFPQCAVTVLVHGGGLATIYNDNNGTQKANPFQANLDGSWIFYADDGRYDIQTSGANFPQAFTYLDVLLCDPFVAGSVCAGGGGTGGAHNLLSTTHLDTVPFSPPVRGDLVTAQNLISPAGTNPSWSRLPLGTSGQVLTSNGTDALWGTITAGTGITVNFNSSTNTTTISTSGGGGSGCTLPVGGVLYGILGENPKGTCDDSAKATWDKADELWQVGDGTNTITDTFALARVYAFGRGISVTSDDDPFTFGITDVFLNGAKVTLAQTGASADIQYGTVLGARFSPNAGARVSATTGSNVSQWMCLMDGCEDKGAGTPNQRGLSADGASQINVAFNVGLENGIRAIAGSSNTSAFVIGEQNVLLANNATEMSDNFIFGELNTLNSSTAAAATVDHSVTLGFTNALSSTTNAVREVFVMGDTNTITNSSGSNMLDVVLIGKSLTATNCSDCYLFGENGSTTTSNSIGIGMSATPEVRIAAGSITLSPLAGSGTSCVQTNNSGVISATGSGCGTSSGVTLVASGTSALATSAISSATCATVVTTAATGALTTDNLSADFNADPTSTTGYQASASGMLTIIKYITANNVNFKVCNNTSGSITPGAVTLQWRVLR